MIPSIDQPIIKPPGPLGRWLRPARVQIISTAVVVVISVADYSTGPYLAFATFYLVPIVYMAWFAGRARALTVAFLAVVLNTAAIAANRTSAPAWILILNGTFMFGAFAFIVYLVDSEHTTRLRFLHLSTTDPMTGLLNRRAFAALADDRLRLASRTGEPVTVIYTDLDDLKKRNDERGHDAGDEMIINFGEALLATFRDSDLVTRIGGDEFCCLLSGIDESGAISVIERLEASLPSLGPDQIRASIGAVSTVPDDGITITHLVHEADRLMYSAKQSGKGRHRTRTLRPSRSSDELGSEAS